MPDETAMLLTQEEWDDLAAMVEAYKDATAWAESNYALAWRHQVELGERLTPIVRRRALADRIIEANSPV